MAYRPEAPYVELKRVETSIDRANTVDDLRQIAATEGSVIGYRALGRLYGLTRDELRYILDPADIYGLDFPGETFRVLKEKEIREYGEYRTQRLVLAAWDAQQAAIEAMLQQDISDAARGEAMRTLKLLT